MRRALALAVVVAGCSGGSDASVRDAGRAPDATGPEAGDDAAPDSPASDAPDGTGPPYPIVLAHGFFGFEDFAGAGFVDYFWRVRQTLLGDGETRVFTPAVDPFNDSTARGAQLRAAVESIVAETGAARVNLIGHSQGGLDARVVLFERPDLVASVTTIASPHGGTELADVILGLVSDDRVRDLADALARAIAAPLYDADGAETSVFDALRQFSSPGVAEFDRTYGAAPRAPFFSIAGRTDGVLGIDVCGAEDRPAFITRLDLERDPVDPLLSLSEEILDDGLAANPNDGLVRVSRSKLGRFLGCIPADHLDEIGHLLGDAPGIGNDLDHGAFYRDLVRWLRAQGL